MFFELLVKKTKNEKTSDSFTPDAIVNSISELIAQSAGAVEYTDYFSVDTFWICPEYDTKSDDEVPVLLELWGMRSTPSLPTLPGPLWPRVVTPDRILSIGQIELNSVFMLNWIVWNRTVLTFNSVNKNYTYTKLNCLN